MKTAIFKIDNSFFQYFNSMIAYNIRKQFNSLQLSYKTFPLVCRSSGTLLRAKLAICPDSIWKEWVHNILTFMYIYKCIQIRKKWRQFNLRYRHTFLLFTFFTSNDNICVPSLKMRKVSLVLNAGNVNILKKDMEVILSQPNIISKHKCAM